MDPGPGFRLCKDNGTELGTAGEVREYILKAFDEDRYEEVEGMTKPMVCYSLIEV